MEVMCIKNSSEAHLDGVPVPNDGPQVEVGEYYNVVRKHTFPDGIYYELLEFPLVHDTLDVFHSRLFAVPSELDEMELVNHKEEVV